MTQHQNSETESYLITQNRRLLENVTIALISYIWPFSSKESHTQRRRSSAFRCQCTHNWSAYHTCNVGI